MENVKMVNWETMSEDELVNVMLQEEENMASSLDRGLAALVGKCVNVFVSSSVQFEQYFDNFDYSYISNCHDKLLLDLKDSEDEEKSSITTRMDSIVDVKLDDNSREIELDLMEEYHVENIFLEMQNSTKIRLELQW